MKLKKVLAILLAIVISSDCLSGLIDLKVQAKDNKVEDKVNLDKDAQIDELYDKIAKELSMSSLHVKTLHLLAGGKAVYADKVPNIYKDLTIQSIQEPMRIAGANTKYIKANKISSDNNIERPSKYYLPDAIYSVSYDIKKIMDERLKYNRGKQQRYFDILDNDVKNNIAFYEAVMQYTGEDINTVNSIQSTYEVILKCKDANENVIEVSEDGKIKLKDKFIKNISINSNNQETLDKLAIMLSFDKYIATNESTESLRQSYIIPYEINNNTRENMLLAAFCLVGKVRYIWGGGHNGACTIDGINPVWREWEDLYPDTQYSEVVSENGEVKTVLNNGYNCCIKPSGSWCPEHGYTNAEFHGGAVYSADDYINNRISSGIIKETNTNKLNQYKSLMAEINYNKGINIHKLDGLDCSGFVSWVYNQITDDYRFDSVAQYFNNQNGMQQLEFGSNLLPGDTFAWTSHIVLIVGKVRDNSRAYVTVEQTRNLIKFGVAYYNNASSSDVAYAKQIANEANSLIGGVGENENAHVYCINNVGYYTEEIPLGEVNETTVLLEQNIEENTAKIQKHFVSLGRYKGTFSDSESIVAGYDKKMIDMTAKEIIENALKKMPVDYVSGYNLYEGEIFNKFLVGSDLK